ncbi:MULTISPECIES: DUF5411 family protein [Bacillus]|uniref:DUF5411 family protein n=1 Tax=Bacillus TaxID=1386 RepID=UPI000BF29159|nr:hypothetical protein [Bacillus wiedmannii]MBJ8115942.1 hypothetical protein [Bacillus cereus]RFB12337.1 hypothetical protein DZB88_16460 [Bacillus sp. OE]RFB22380.1 hypothetical protein DZB85_18625 [Bacillus sp. LB(2018)]RFB68205.1 hypothetical protein DZB94_29025 [Bacillus sp. AW]
MQKFIVASSMLLLFVGCLFFVTDMVMGDTTHTDNKSSLERGGEIALAKSVKIGTLRAEEEMAIDKEKAKQEFEKAYNGNADFKNPASKRNFTVHDVREKPAMIAVEGDAEVASYFKQFDEKKETIKSKARSIIIYDANAKEKQLGGNVK